MLTYNILSLLLAGYVLGLSFIVTTKDGGSAIIFKVIPAILGTMVAFFAFASLNGWPI